MESALAPPTRLIEYPNEFANCASLDVQGKQLLYTCMENSNASLQFVIVLGFDAGKREDFVTKNLIEPIEKEKRDAVKGILALVLTQSAKTQVFFL